MRLFPSLFARTGSIAKEKSKRRGRIRSRGLHFEQLEDRRALTAQSFSVIGATDYFADPAFSQYDGTDYAIAILDTGADLDHPDFGPSTGGVANRIVYDQDFVNNDNDASDDHGHGTHHASIIARLAPGANLIILKVLNQEGGIGDSGVADIEEALTWVLDNRTLHNIIAVNISFAFVRNEGDGVILNFEQELNALQAERITTVASAGNYWKHFEDSNLHVTQQGIAYPASATSAMAIGATWDADVNRQDKEIFAQLITTTATDFTTGTDRIASFSQRHETALDVFAPGGLVSSGWLDGGTEARSGTGVAAAHVTAAVALAQHQRVAQGGARFTQTELRNLFRDTGVAVYDGDNEDDNVTNTDLTFKRLNVLGVAYKQFKPAALDLKFTSDWGFSETDNKTYDTTPTLSGTVPEGAYVWIYDSGTIIDSFQVAAGVSTFERTLTSALSIATHNLTIKVAENSSVAEANRSQASNALSVVIANSDSKTLGTESYAARMSETLVVSGDNSVASSTMAIDWSVSPPAITKTGTGTVTVATVDNRSVPIRYNSDAGITQFTTNVGVPPVGAQAHVANWSIYARKPGASASTIEFAASQNLNLLDIDAGAKVVMADHGSRALSVFTLDVDASGTLDLRNNDMIIRATEATKDAVHANAEARIVSARNGLDANLYTNWNGTGITSTFAREQNVNNEDFDLVGLGVIRNSDLNITTGTSNGAHTSWGGQDVGLHDVLIKFTYTGDADLNGIVNFQDYVGMDNAYWELIEYLGWATGDVNYDGVINFDDYGLVDNAFESQHEAL